ncbi:MAG TPA: M18 family aminopeptidase [Candidatus Lumbricidophila sp.]|nr:M18 family aminopeptidase [Candidatus Lumbricidophila sp.]
MGSSAARIDQYTAAFADFITASPSAFHAANEVAGQLEARGFARVDEASDWAEHAKPGARAVIVRDGAVVAWAIPDAATAVTPFRIVGAHTDSPSFKLETNPSYSAAGLSQASVEVYGGPLLNSWLDRELSFAGRLVTRDGVEHLVRTAAIARIPQLAIHLDREQNSGLSLDRQRHMQPVYAMADADIVAHLAALAGVDRDAVGGWDVYLADTNPPARFGLDREFFAAGRLDNLSSVFAGLRGFVGSDGSARSIRVLAAFDHEEVGSGSTSGASGPLLEDVLHGISEGLGGGAAEYRRAARESWLVSADAGHAVHPNYPDRHDPQNRPLLGGGPLLKLNAGQKYATDARGAALWAGACDAAGVEFQTFVSNNTVPCGSTIGPLSATRLGIQTVDVGTPLLSMHSARELAHVGDLAALGAALEAFYRG